MGPYNWSFDDREVRGSLVYRAFDRIGGERVPDAKALVRLAHLLEGPVLKALLEHLVTIGREQRIVRGQRMRGRPILSRPVLPRHLPRCRRPRTQLPLSKINKTCFGRPDTAAIVIDPAPRAICFRP